MPKKSAGESLPEYLAELCRLTEKLDYRDQLEDMLRDQLVCGTKHECIQDLLSQGDSLTLQQALNNKWNQQSIKHQ